MQKKKSLGQHFLHSRHYLEMVADAADVTQEDTVVEIGPGEGSLTSLLLERGTHVVALEKDSRLMSVLAERFTQEIQNKRLVIIEGDALDFDISRSLQKTQKFTVVGNIPYYITGALLRKFLSATQQPSTLVFLMQKEVAERIARSKKESVLSLSVKAYGEPKLVAKVPRGAFAPPPKVDSAIVVVNNISRKNFKNKAHEHKFFELVKKGFSSKRKKLAGNLGKAYSDILTNVGVPKNARAEDVPLAQWLALSKVEGL